MTQAHRATAEKLGRRLYTEFVARELTTEDVPIYLGRVKELPGCLAQGNTVEEAIADLQEAKIDYIESLLEDGLPVPAPVIITGSSPLAEDLFTGARQKDTEDAPLHADLVILSV